MDELNSVASDSVDRANELVDLLIQYGSAFGLKIIFAVLFWIVGRWMIGFIVRFVQRSMTRQKIDQTVLRYVGSFITVTLNIILVIAILGYCGIETTSFAAILAAVGLAIGMAWSGLLANFAAGGFIIVLRPFKVGDEIGAGGVVGTVTEIGLFVTTVNTADNVLTLVGNGVFQGSCRVNRLTMPLVSRSVALDPGSAARCRSAPSYASGLTTAPVCFPWLVRTAHVAGPRPDDPAPDAALSA